MRPAKANNSKNELTTSSHVSKQSGAQTLHKAISLIRAVAHYEDSGERMSKIASRLGLPTTTVHRILSVLVQEGLIEYDPLTKHYHLGIELYALGLKAHKFAIREKYRMALESIAKKTEETTYLVARSGNDAVCIDRVIGTYPIQVLTFEIGQRRPLGIGGGSVAILASLADDEVEKIISSNSNQYPKFQKRTAEDVRKMVKTARKNGFGLSEKNVTEETIGLGVPILNNEGKILASISVAGIQKRMKSSRYKEIANTIRAEIERVD